MATSPRAPRTTSRVLPTPKVIPIIPAKLAFPPTEIIKGTPHYNEPPMKAWSFSSLGDFEKCRYYSYLKRVQKIPEPVRALPPGKTEHANDRGSRIHDQAEQFVRGTLKLIPELSKFSIEFDALARSFKRGETLLEGEWGMSKDWEEVPYAKAWLRLKLDALFFISPTEAVAIDYKTGRIFGNEVKHAEQLQLYQLVTFLRYPQLETVHTELWYLDHDEVKTMTYQRNQGLRFRYKWDKRGSAMMDARDFPANPNMFSCRFCMYGPRGSGVCERGV